MKRTLTLLVAALLLLTMIVPMTAASAEEKTTLTILWWGSQTRHDLTVKLIEKFEEKYPEIDVVMDYSDWGGYWTKLAAQVAGGQTPDIFQMDYAYLAQYAENGVLAPLNAFTESGALDVSKVSENILTSGTVNGSLYAISTGTNAPVMLYRKDLLEQAGVTLPMIPTMSEYIAASKAVCEATGKDISMVAIPNMDDATASATYLKPSMFWCVAEQCQNKDAAIKFLNFFTNDPDCFDIVGIDRAIPISSDMRAHVTPNLDTVSQEVSAFVDLMSEPGNASPLMNPDPSCHSEVAELLGQYSEQVRYEMIDDLQATAEQFMQEANDILANARANAQ